VTRRWPVAALGAAAVSYSTWVLGPVLNPAIDASATVASELAATDQPWSWVFRSGDVMTGVLALAAGVFLAIPARGWARVAWIGAAIFGLSTILDAGLTPLSCAPSVDPGCTVLGSGGLSAEIGEPHSFTSSFAVAGAMASLVALTLRLRRPAPRFALVGAALAALAIATSLVTLTQIISESDTEGLWQRGQLAGISAWLVYAAVAAGRRG
jgi:Protein of unknown function (DUF998)